MSPYQKTAPDTEQQPCHSLVRPVPLPSIFFIMTLINTWHIYLLIFSQHQKVYFGLSSLLHSQILEQCLGQSSQWEILVECSMNICHTTTWFLFQRIEAVKKLINLYYTLSDSVNGNWPSAWCWIPDTHPFLMYFPVYPPRPAFFLYFSILRNSTRLSWVSQLRSLELIFVPPSYLCPYLVA